MAESGCSASLIKLTSCPDLDCKRLAMMTLCNLTANAETRGAATRGGGLQAAVRLTQDADGECRRYAATCVCNMANDHQMQVRRRKINAMQAPYSSRRKVRRKPLVDILEVCVLRKAH